MWEKGQLLRLTLKSELAKRYLNAAEQWDNHLGYFANGRLSPDNNAAENTIPPSIIYRNNRYFYFIPPWKSKGTCWISYKNP